MTVCVSMISSSGSVSTSVTDECESVASELSSVQLGSCLVVGEEVLKRIIREVSLCSTEVGIAHQVGFKGPRLLLPALPQRASSRDSGTDAAQEHFGVDPLEGLGEDVADIGQVEQKQRHPDDRVQNGRHLSPLCARRDVAVSWRTNGQQT